MKQRVWVLAGAAAAAGAIGLGLVLYGAYQRRIRAAKACLVIHLLDDLLEDEQPELGVAGHGAAVRTSQALRASSAATLAAAPASSHTITLTQKTCEFASGYLRMARAGVRVLVCKSPETCSFAINELLKDLASSGRSETVLGLDAEWRPPNKGGTGNLALLQLSSTTVVVLVHFSAMDVDVSLYSQALPELVQLLNDSSIVKVGVAIGGDASKLRKDLGLEVHGCLDLQEVAKKLSEEMRPSKFSLRVLSKWFLDAELPKDSTIRCGDWEANPLSVPQIMYAAADSFISREIYFAIHDLSTGRGKASFLKRIKEIEEKKHSDPKAKHPSRSSESDFDEFKNSKKYQRALNLIIPRKEPLYENCKMLGPDGTLLCTCPEKKIRWYLSKDLADIVCEDPLTIKLRFEPKGQGHAGDEFYLSKKENICVVCGDEKEYTRFRVVPHSYRRHFPDKMKSHSSHDIVLLCPKCSIKANNEYSRMFKKIAEEYGVALGGESQADEESDFWKEKRRNKGRALCNALKDKSEGIPEERKEQLFAELVEIVQEVEPDLITDLDETKDEEGIHSEFLNKCYEAFKDAAAPSKASVRHGELIMKAILKDESGEELKKFIRKWRQHFLDSMEPKFISPYWRVDHEDRE